MNEVLIWIKDILGQYATPIIAVATFISGLIVIIKTVGLGKLFSGLKTLIAGIFGKEENSPVKNSEKEDKENSTEENTVKSEEDNSFVSDSDEFFSEDDKKDFFEEDWF